MGQVSVPESRVLQPLNDLDPAGLCHMGFQREFVEQPTGWERSRTSHAAATAPSDVGVLGLHRMVGNKAVTRLLHTDRLTSAPSALRATLQRLPAKTSGAPSISITGSMPAIFMEYGSTRIHSDGAVDSMIHFMHSLVKIREYEKKQRAQRKVARIILHGSASADGDKARNLALSQQRADRIKELLVDAGVAARIETIGHGASGTFPDLASNRCVLNELVGDSP